jgi:hypothetical protein
MEPLPRDRSLVVWRKHQLKINKRKRVRTICEVLRELYRDAEQRQDHLTMTRLEEAHDMAKRMQAKLASYAGKSGDPIYLGRVADNEAQWMTKPEFKRHE